VEIVNNIAVRFECPSDIAQTIKSYIERSEVLDEKDGIADVVVHWGLDEMQRLSYLTRYFTIPNSEQTFVLFQ